MKNTEFTSKKFKDATVYTLESASGGGTSAGSIASVSNPVGAVQRRNPGQNLIAQEADKNKIVIPSSNTAPRKGVPPEIMKKGGAHKDKKKAAKQGDQKHKNREMDMAEGYNTSPFDQIENLKSKSNKELDDLAIFWQNSLKKNPNHKVANDQLHIIKMIRAERIGKKGVAEAYGRSNYGYNPDRDAERAWDAAQRSEQDFRNRERNAGLEDEEEYYRQQVNKDRGPWYLKINGKIYKQQGIPKSFDWKKGANNYALAILKKRPELQDKIFLTKKATDDQNEDHSTATGGWGQGAYASAVSGSKWAGAGHDEVQREDAYIAELFDKLQEKIPKNAPVDVWIKDFEKSNAPQFRGKTKEKRRQMAIAASYGAKNPSKKK